jgi:hypothetical protein
MMHYGKIFGLKLLALMSFLVLPHSAWASDGPFGLTFGQSASSVPLKFVQQLNPIEDQEVMTTAYSCKDQISGTSHGVVPKSWRLESSLYIPKGPHSKILDSLVEENKFRINWRDHGIKHDIYKVELGGKSFNVCLGFFEDQLYSVVSYWAHVKDFEGELVLSLTQKYGPPEIWRYGKIWVSESKGVKVTYGTSGLIYFYAPLRQKVMERQFYIVNKKSSQKGKNF